MERTLLEMLTQLRIILDHLTHRLWLGWLGLLFSLHDIDQRDFLGLGIFGHFLSSGEIIVEVKLGQISLLK